MTNRCPSLFWLLHDAFTKFVLIYPIRSTTTKDTIKSLKDMIKNFGVYEFCKQSGIDHHFGMRQEQFRRLFELRHTVAGS